MFPRCGGFAPPTGPFHQKGLFQEIALAVWNGPAAFPRRCERVDLASLGMPADWCSDISRYLRYRAKPDELDRPGGRERCARWFMRIAVAGLWPERLLQLLPAPGATEA